MNESQTEFTIAGVAKGQNAALLAEEWRWIKGYEGLYSISNHGRVMSYCGSRWRNQVGLIKPGIKQNGYLKVSLYGRGDKSSTNKYIHRLVLLHFGPPPLDNTDVNHIDGDKTNNRFDNLEWTTRSGNMRHAMRVGLWTSKGEANPMRILSEDQVREIRLSYRKSSYHRSNAHELAVIYGVSRQTVTDIISGRRWRHVA